MTRHEPIRRAEAARHPLRGQCLAPGRGAVGACPVTRHDAQASGAPVDGPLGEAGYGRLFPDLPPLAVDAAFLRALGRQGGACDREAGAREASVAAGWPFFGQLVAHDVTGDRSPLSHAADAVLRNARTPRLDLECVYGGGPTGSPYLYDRDDAAKLLLGPGGRDLPRNAQGTALIGDPRNDVHLFVNQLHVAYLRAHNAVVDRLRAGGTPEAAVFEEARRTLTWHHQWVVLHDFLPGLVGPGVVDALPATAGCPSIPVEFADAAYRYGHSQVRQTYRVNAGSGPLSMFPDLIGFRPVPAERAIDWALLFDLPGRPPAQRSERIDGRLPAALLRLPDAITGDVDDEADRSLAARDLERGLATALPSGEAVARAIGAEPLTRDEVALPGWEGETPLWLYVLREADVRAGGDGLGPVGGRIVAGTLVSILDAEPASFRNAAPDWTPTLPAAGDGFGLADLLTLSD